MYFEDILLSTYKFMFFPWWVIPLFYNVFILPYLYFFVYVVFF
jgi:hypothetical protein